MKLTKKESDNLKLLEQIRNRPIINRVCIHKGNTYKHELAKCMLAIELIKNNHKIVTEAVFLNRSRADIFDLTGGDALEVLNSETEKMLLAKRPVYPVPIIDFKAEEVINKFWRLTK